MTESKKEFNKKRKAANKEMRKLLIIVKGIRNRIRKNMYGDITIGDDPSEEMSKQRKLRMKDMEEGEFKMGGKLKSVPSDNKGLSKLPTAVRNKMGYREMGGHLNKMKNKSMKNKSRMHGGQISQHD